MNRHEKEIRNLKLQNNSLRRALSKLTEEINNLLQFVEAINSSVDAEEILNKAREIIQKNYTENSDIIIENFQLKLSNISRDWENPELYITKEIMNTIMEGETIFIANAADPFSYLGEHRSYFISKFNVGLQQVYKRIFLEDLESKNLELESEDKQKLFYHIIWKTKSKFKTVDQTPYRQIESLTKSNKDLDDFCNNLSEDIRQDVISKMLIMHENDLKTYAAIPLINNGRTIGFVRIALSFENRHLTENEMPFIKSITNLVVITLNKAEQYHKAVYYDSVTGLPKKILFLKFMENYLKTDKTFSLLFTDLDNFKQYVDTYGHAIANNMINEFGLFVKSNLPESCIVSNYAGDEFMALIPGKNKTEALKDAEMIRAAMETKMFPGEPLEKKITVSIGLSDNLDADSEVGIAKKRDAIIQYADFAMFHSKNSGRNTVSLWSKEIPEKGKGIKVEESNN